MYGYGCTVMGIPIQTADWYRSMVGVDPAFAPGKGFVELGAQEVHDGVATILYPVRSVIESLGMYYDCIDIDGAYGALRLDLNTCTQKDVGRTYDVVTNHGTTEHCFDQENCFRLMHDLCNVGGLMIHCVPTSGDKRSIGFFCYSAELFQDLVAANSYEVVSPLGISDDGWGRSISTFFRKVVDQPFVVPIQDMYKQHARSD